MNKYWKHFKTITKHKWYVMIACFKCGLYKQGLLHDLSKYSLIEFNSSAKYFQGGSSPIDKEKSINGYSLAWQNHKGKNKHHWQYWTDFEDGQLITLKMPIEYVKEMICDWIGAGKAYNKGRWNIDVLKNWYENNKDKIVLHNETRNIIECFLNSLSEKDIFIQLNKLKYER